MLNLLVASAIAGSVYVNGTLVDPIQMTGVTFEKVTVRVDAQGNLWVDAPGYRIQVMGTPPAPTPYPPAPQPGYGYPPAPAPAPYVAPPAPYVAPPAPYSPPVPAPVVSGGGRPASTQAPLPSGVLSSRWWMVTEDAGTTGHTIEVWINGQMAYTVLSGQAQKIVDVGRFLRLGPNQVQIRSNSTNPSGGSFFVYLGTGSDQSGTVVMDNPVVQFGVAARPGTTQRDFTLNVDR